MKCLIDTNIIISAILFPLNIPSKAYIKAVTSPYNAVICDYSIDELQRVFKAKFPHKIQHLQDFIQIASLSVEIISTPSEKQGYECEMKIRDIKDRPILRSAIAANVDFIITGDKDFLSSGLTAPKIVTAAQFLTDCF